jgi:hypothetical protein
MVKTGRSTFAAREAARQQVREQNRLNWGRSLAEQSSWSGMELVRAACQVAKQTSHRLTETAQRQLAHAIAQAVQAINTPENRTK